MAIGKKSSGSRRAIGAESDAAKAEKKRIAAQLAQKAAQENIAANRQLETARAHAATPGRAEVQLTRAQLISAPTPSRLKDRQKHDREMQAEKLAHDSAENKLSREHTSAENRLARENQLLMQDISLWNQRQMNTERLNADKDANRERSASLERMREIDAKRAAAGNAARLQIEAQKGQNAIALEAQRGKNKLTLEQQKGMFGAGRDAAKYKHELEKLGIKNENDLAKWYRQQEFEEQQRIEAENAKYGIPKNSGISAEDRAKIINGKGAYKYEFGRTEKDEEQIKAMEEALYSPDATESDKVEIAHELEIFKEEHPPVGRAVKVPVEERAPQTTVIGGVTYMNNNGKWEMVNDSNADRDLRNRDLEMRRKDLEAKRYQEAILKIEQGKKVTQMVEVPGSLEPKAITITVPYTEEEKAAILKRLFPDRALPEEPKPAGPTASTPSMPNPWAALFGAESPLNPMVGGSEAQPPSVAPTPTPTPTPKTPPPMPDPTIYSQALSPVGIQPTVGGIPLTGFMNGPVSEPPNIEAIQASLPEGMAVLPPNKNGQFFIIDSMGNAIGYVDAQGVKWKIIYGQNGKPMGKVPMQ